MHGDTALLLPPRVRFPTHAIRSARWSSYAVRTLLVAPASERSLSVTCFQVLRRTVLATAISTDRSYSQLYHLPLADAMIDVTQVILLSVCREFRSELFFDIFCIHSVPVKVASRSTPGGETAGQLQCKRLSIRYHSYAGKRQAATNTTPLLHGMQAATFTCAE